MNLEALVNEIKEFAKECVWKNEFECIKAPDSVILMYLKSLMYPQDFEIFMRYKETLLRIFRESAKEEIEWLNS
jgi:hypothetical protein